jgi:intein/homing endonuclease
MREGYYIINGELEITNDHPILTNGVWKRTEDLLIGDDINGIRVDTKQYISKTTKTVSVVTQSDDYNVYCNENLYTVHGRYKLFLQQEDRSAA